METVLVKINQQAVVLLWVLIGVVILDIVIHLISVKTKRQSAGRAMKKEQKALLTLQEKGDEAFVLVRSETGEPVYVSKNLESVYGISQATVYSEVEAILRGFKEIDSRKMVEELKRWDRQEGLCFQGHWSVGTKEMECKITVLHSEQPPYDLITLNNVTEQQEKVEQLEQKIIETRNSEEAKTAFLSNMSHEIRTPLNGMLGMIGLTKMNIDNPQLATEYLEQSEELSNFLLSVINDILDMSRIESGKTELEKVPFDMRELGEKLTNMFKSTLEGKGISYIVEMDDITDPYVVGDQLRIGQVLTNFLSNSSKFTPKGGTVNLMIKQMDVVGDRISWMFRVKDTGKGMTQSFLHRIFKPFEQEDSGITRKYGGSGLGMAIADNLVRLMGGQILVESELGKGTTFTVFVKLPKADPSELREMEQEEKLESNISLEGRTFLVAEDQAVNALILNKMLGSKGIKVEVAEDGEQVVDMFTSHDDGYYDIILMDIHMPKRNGWEAAKMIRGCGKPQGRTIPIFALSADAFVEDKRKSMESGMDGHITKPIDYAELENKVRKSLR